MCVAKLGPHAKALGEALLTHHAKQLANLSFDAMAIVFNHNIVWCNRPFCSFAESLGDGNLESGLSYLRQHFDNIMPSNGMSWMSEQQIQGASGSAIAECNVCCVGDPSTEFHQYLWVLRPKQMKAAPDAKPLIVADPEVADPRVKVLVETTNKRTAQPQIEKHNLWNKYGCKVVAIDKGKHKSSGPNDKVQRSYYKCYAQDCIAKLTVDLEPLTMERIRITSSGVLNAPK